MRGHIPQAFDAGGFHGGLGVEALGDGVADEGGALFLEEFDLPRLLRDQPVNPRRLPVQERRYCALFVEGGTGNWALSINTFRGQTCVMPFAATLNWSASPSALNARKRNRPSRCPRPVESAPGDSHRGHHRTARPHTREPRYRPRTPESLVMSTSPFRN